jgi:hypothetical protein
MSVHHVLILVACIATTGCSSNTSPQEAGDGGTSDGQPAVDVATGMDGAPDAPPPLSDAARDGAGQNAWGDPCTVGNDTTCGTGLFCLQGPNGGSVGFCTETCPSTSSGPCSGTPAGMAAFCVVTDVDTQGDKGCAFACRIGSQTWTCPGALTCETMDDPPDSGQRLCVP